MTTKLLFHMQPVLATLGNYNHGTGKEAAIEGINNLNSILETVGLSIGAILIAIALIRIIMSFATEDSKSKMDAGMMFGAGIIFISLTTVLKLLNIDAAATGGSNAGNQIAANIIELLGNALTFVGVIVFLFAVFSLIVAIAQENSDGFSNASKLLMSGTAMIFGDGVLGIVKTLLIQGQKDANVWVREIVNMIANVATWGALGFIICGVFKFVTGLRTEDDKDRNTGVRFFMVGIALLSIEGVFMLFGFIDTPNLPIRPNSNPNNATPF